MLKILFSILLLANAGLFAFHQGYLDGLLAPNREPARLSRQINADKIRMVPADAAKPPGEDRNKPTAAPEPAATQSVTPAEPVLVAADAPTAAIGANAERIACTEIGNFNEADASRFEQQLAVLALGNRLSRRVIQEKTSYMVFMPAQGNKENADKKVAQLRALGVTDFYVIQDSSELRWGISLGIFSSETAAQARLAQLNQQGVRSARIGERNAASKLAFQLRDLDGATRDGLEKIRMQYPQQQMRNCA